MVDQEIFTTIQLSKRLGMSPTYIRRQLPVIPRDLYWYTNGGHLRFKGGAMEHLRRRQKKGTKHEAA